MLHPLRGIPVILAVFFLCCDAGIVGNIFSAVKGAVGLDRTTSPASENTEIPLEKSLQVKVEEVLKEMENVMSHTKEKQQENVKILTERLANLEINTILIRENVDNQFSKFQNKMEEFFERTQKKMDLLNEHSKGLTSNTSADSEHTELLPEIPVQIKLQEALKELEKVLSQAGQKQQENEKILTERLINLEIKTLILRENFDDQFSKFQNKMEKLFEKNEKKMELLHLHPKGVIEVRNPTNELPPQTINAIMGNSIDLQCTIAKCVNHLSNIEDNFNIVWKVNDNELNFEEDRKFSLTSTLGLKIRSLTTGDSGNYSCEIKTHDFIEKQSYHLLVSDRTSICSDSLDDKVEEQLTEIGKVISQVKDKQKNLEKLITKMTKV